MHAGEAGKGRGQRANGGKISAITVETSKLAGKREEKCTPVRRGRAGASVQTEAKCPPSSSRRPRRRGNRIKNARRRGGERQKPACKRRQIAHRQRRDVQGGGETGRKMHAGEAEKGRSQRANGGKLPTVNVETSKAAGKREEKCTPVRRRKEEAGVQTEADCAPSSSRRPRRGRNRIKNARRRGGERQKPACKRRQIAHRQRRDVQGGGETG